MRALALLPVPTVLAPIAARAASRAARAAAAVCGHVTRGRASAATSTPAAAGASCTADVRWDELCADDHAGRNASSSPLLPPQPPPPERVPPIDCTGPSTFTHDGFYKRFSIEGGWLGAQGVQPRAQ